MNKIILLLESKVRRMEEKTESKTIKWALECLVSNYAKEKNMSEDEVWEFLYKESKEERRKLEKRREK
ncbi:hypothetical protein [Bacillus pseudomycoides]|uniref:hypothetical protein n=2 Tax=Bacillus pseudomycoides TaxID=64104 RepID=UPI001155538B|nr:hypothetical protein [Bacillus pseudomycoides]